jgi:hypothetical protein
VPPPRAGDSAILFAAPRAWPALRLAPPALLIALALAAAFAPPLARAGTEEFSTFHVNAWEEDDESVIDHLLARKPLAWRDDWERAPLAFRTEQGCLTSGQWFMNTQLKLETAVGRKAKLALHYDDVEGDVSSYQYLDLWLRFPIRVGTLGAMFRPFHDKSRQDFALAWELGADTTAYRLRATWGFEDLFNNLWSFRQSRVGGLSEPYRRHPWEPALELAVRRAGWRAELAATYRTPSVQRRAATAPATPDHDEGLWGTLVRGALEADVGGFRAALRGGNQQARSTDQPLDYSTGDAANFRRAWNGEVALARALTPRLDAEARWLYVGRTEGWEPPLGPAAFAGVDRVLQLEGRYAFAPALSGRVGYLHDQLTIAESGAVPWVGEGSRKESRAYFGLTARFGNVSVSGAEGIELDLEPYQVWFHHDKAFLEMQATF